MKKTLLAALLVLSLASYCRAADTLTPQQEKMKSCNTQAAGKNLSGDARKKFMSSCLSASGGTQTATSPQERMKSCNAEATSKGLKDGERKSFMSHCLQGS